jgi:hypothetical protein
MESKIMKKMYAFVLISLIVIGVCGYFGYDFYLKKNIESGLSETLKDPESILISDLKYNSNGACGYYNAKNSYGGYVGKKFFYGEFIGGKFFKILDNDESIYALTQCENLGLIVR